MSGWTGFLYYVHEPEHDDDTVWSFSMPLTVPDIEVDSAQEAADIMLERVREAVEHGRIDVQHTLSYPGVVEGDFDPDFNPFWSDDEEDEDE